MKISLVGMSGSGKSYWSKKLQKKGFRRFCCDDLIEAKLGDALKKLGYSGIQDVAKWMGQPFDEQHTDASRKYLQCEKEILEKIAGEIRKIPDKEDIVIDTTGSVIYMKKNILDKLIQLTKIIYLNIPASVKDDMYKLYLSDPKPIVWGNSFKKNADESNMEALSRCYPKLLASRAQKYEKIAHIVLDYAIHRRQGFSIDAFIKTIR